MCFFPVTPIPVILSDLYPFEGSSEACFFARFTRWILHK